MHAAYLARWMGFTAFVVVLLAYVPFVTSLSVSASRFERLKKCDAGKDTIQKTNPTTYLLCQRPPEILSKVYGSNGLWFKWTCNNEGAFDFGSCKPALEEFHEEMKQIMNDLVFCDEESWADGAGEQKPTYQPSCVVERAPLISDARNITLYYACQLDNAGDKCGHWVERTCDEDKIFASALQKCVSEVRLRSRGSRMIPMVASPMTPYGGFPYAFDFGPFFGGMPMMPAAALPPAVPTSVPIQALQQYYVAMYPWFSPNVMGKPFVPGVTAAQTQGVPGGQAQGGSIAQAPGAIGGQTGGGALPGLGNIPGLGGGGGAGTSGGATGGQPGGSTLPGLGKLPGLGGGSGTGTGSSIPGLGKLPGLG